MSTLRYSLCSFLVWSAARACLVIVVVGNSVIAQPPEMAGGQSAEERTDRESRGSSTPLISEKLPEAYYLPDENGKLVLVPNMTFEDFQRLLLIDRELAHGDQPSRYSLQRMLMHGIAGEEHAELDVEFTVLIQTDELVGVPLRLPNVVLREAAEYQGPGEHFLDYDEARGGYVSWIRGPAEARHVISLKALVPLTQVGGQTTLTLRAPRTTSSQMTVTVPVPDAAAEVSDGANITQRKSLGDGRTELTVLGINNDFQLRWRQHAAPPTETPTLLEVQGHALVRINGPAEIRTEAELTLRSYGRPIDSFQVRLPAGHELVSSDQQRYTVSATRPVDDKTQNRDGPVVVQTVEVKPRENAPGPLRISLVTELTRPYGDTADPVNVAGFEVIPSPRGYNVRQWGDISLVAAPDLLLDWSENAQIRRVSELTDAPWLEKPDASFEYYRQPYSLNVRVRTQKPRVTVEPTYVVYVEKSLVRLEANLRYSIRGAAESFLNLNLPGWEVNSVKSEGNVRDDWLDLDDVAPLRIPLAGVGTGEFDVRVEADQRLSDGLKQLSIDLPDPEVSRLLPATVVVVPAENIQLSIRSQDMQRFSPTPLPAQLSFPEAKQEPLCYRIRADSPPTRLVYDFAIRPRTIGVGVDSRVFLDVDRVRVEQTFKYQIDYAPVDAVGITLPPSLTIDDTWRWELDGEPLDPMSSRAETRNVDETRPRVFYVNLPVPRRGSCTLAVQYTFSMTPAPADMATAVTVPLVMPADEDEGIPIGLTTNALSVSRSSAISAARPDDSSWTVRDESNPTQGPRTLRLQSAERLDHVDLTVTGVPRRPSNSTVIDGAFAQVWLLGGARQDRVVFRFTTGNDHLPIRLPEAASSETVLALLDGNSVTAEQTSAGHFAVELPPKARGEYVLELMYSCPQRPPPGKFALDAAEIEDASFSRRAYWQLITPTDEHLIVGPTDMTSEDAWAWRRFYWCRQPVHDQREIEQWLGATRQPAAPANANTYLYSTVGSAGRFEVRTEGRRPIVAVCSLASLVMGLMLIYVPVVRHPLVLFTASVLLLSAGVLSPAPAMIAIQAASLGFVLVFLARVLQWSLRGHAEKHSLVQGHAMAPAEPSTTELRFDQREGSSQTSSASANVVLRVSAPEAKA